MASIKDVAKMAGVAISTVSKVLNGYPSISEDTKVKVNKAIEELGYVPNAVAAALSSKQAGRIALLINLQHSVQAADEINMQYLSGTINKARELGLDVVTVFFSMMQGKSFDEVVNYFRSQSITGIIVYGMTKEDAWVKELVDKQLFKMVLVDVPLQNQNTSCVWPDQAKAQYDVAEKTMKMDTIPYKSVLYIAGTKSRYATKERLLGIEKFAKDYSLELHVEYGDFSEKKAREVTFTYGRDYDMIVCASDLMAMGAMRALTEMDVFHPVCGFDGLTLMGYAGMLMNTVKQDFYKMAQEAVSEMERLLSGEEGRKVTVEYTLVRMEYQDIIC